MSYVEEGKISINNPSDRLDRIHDFHELKQGFGYKMWQYLEMLVSLSQ